MANHLTPDELAKELNIDRDTVIRVCVDEGVPIYHGKIDKTPVPGTASRAAAIGRGRSAEPVERRDAGWATQSPPPGVAARATTACSTRARRRGG